MPRKLRSFQSNSVLKEVLDNEELEPLAWHFVMMYLQLVEGSRNT